MKLSSLAPILRDTLGYFTQIGQFNRNIRLCLAVNILSALSLGIFSVTFNLYILSLGITPDVLGTILSANPFAQALGSIPAGFIAELIGFRYAFGIIYSSAGVAQLAQVSTEVVPLIFLAAFVGGLGLSGDFVVRLPFLSAYSEPSQRTHLYTVSSLSNTLFMAIGALFAGFAPNFFILFAPNLTIAYRWTLYVSGALMLVALIPTAMMRIGARPRREHIGLGVYLWGMDRFTFQQAVVSLFMGLTMGLVFPFMNLYFILHLNASREFFGTISALSILPLILGTALAPAIAARFGSVKAVTYLRLVIPICLILMAFTVNPLLGTLGFWGLRALVSMSQPLSFAFAMEAAAPRAKVAASAWLNVTFWLGNALAAPIAGAFLAQSNYTSPYLLATTAMLVAAVCNQVFFGPLETKND